MMFDLADPSTTVQSMPLRDLWRFLPFGYLITILIETPVLLVGLAKPVTIKQRLWCGVWLTACTYPIVVIVLPAIFFGQSRLLYVTVAEIFAPVAECLLFWLAFRNRDLLNGKEWMRSLAAIVIANLASFGIGEVMGYFNVFGIFY